MLIAFKRRKQVYGAWFRGFLLADLCPDFLLCCRHRIAFTEVADLFKIVNQAVKQPLDVDLDLTSKGEPVQSLAAANVAEHRFYNA